MNYSVTIHMPTRTFNRINRLLRDIYDLNEMTDKELDRYGADKNTREEIYRAYFADGSSITYDLCSGEINYYDDVVWYSADKKTSCVFDYDFELYEESIYSPNNKDTYIVRIIKV